MSTVSPRSGWRLSLLILLVGTGLSVSVAQAQRSSQPTPVPATGRTPPATNRTPTPAPAREIQQPAAPNVGGAIEFSNETIALEEIGLVLQVPAGAAATRRTLPSPPTPGGAPPPPQTTIEILPEDQSWRIIVRAPHVDDPGLTAAQCADQALKLLQDSVGIAAADPSNKDAWKDRIVDTKVKLLSRVPNAQDPKARLFGNGDRQLEYERWYALVPQGKNEPNVLRGLTVSKVGDTQFLIFDLNTTDKSAATAKPIYEAMIAAATFRKPEDVNLNRGMAIEQGLNITRTLTDADILAVINQRPERWFRLFKPSKTGRKDDDTEVGYIRFQFLAGQRGQVDRDSSKSSWGPAEREQGYVVLSDARFLKGSNVIDSQAGYFLRKDREAEFWSITTALRDVADPRKAAAVGVETGAREKKSLQIEVHGTGIEAQTIRPIVQNDAYLSRVESILMPQLLIKSRAMTDYAYYTWVSEAGKVRLRRDSLERPAGSNTGWVVRTRFGDDEKLQVSTYREDGELVRTEMPEGTIWEPSTYEELYRLWTNKNLPVGTSATEPSKRPAAPTKNR